MKTIDITPTWENLVPAFLALIENGDAKGRETAIAEITRMAKVADMHVAASKAAEAAASNLPLGTDERFGADAYPAHLDGTERQIIDRAIRDILAKGYCISVYGEGNLDLAKSTDYAAITDAVGATGITEFSILSCAPDVGCRKIGWVQFVHGNAGYEIISDYTANLETEALLADAIALAATFEEAAA